MESGRRDFLRITGLTVLGLGVRPAGDLLASEGSKGTDGQGTRWAMVVNLKRCLSKKGCTDCVEACHVAHNVPSFPDLKDEVKWIWKEPFENVFHDLSHEFQGGYLKGESLPILCNHCDNPPCVRVCPTKATWKRPDGIVAVDYHRCIGCRYCVVACPYDSRSFNWKDPRGQLSKIDPAFPTRMKGVVEKCTFCVDRLDKGLQPLCVEACREKAMVFGNLAQPRSEVRRLLENNYTIRRKPALGTNPEVYYII